MDGIIFKFFPKNCRVIVCDVYDALCLGLRPALFVFVSYKCSFNGHARSGFVHGVLCLW